MPNYNYVVFAGAALIFAVGCGVLLAQDKGPATIASDWAASPHANKKSESFTHWDKDGSVPVRCAKCHSGHGFQDFLGADGSPAGKVDKAAKTGAVIGCDACHNDKAKSLDRVTFPSGETVASLGKSAVCTVCHQGRQSTPQVNKAIAGLGADAVSEKLRFINVHYRASAATLFGSMVKGGYEYAGKSYQGRLTHPLPFNTCTGCHDAHKTSVKETNCKTCHRRDGGVRAIRTLKVDVDGDGDRSEGIRSEIETLHAILGRSISQYAKTVVGTAIAYDKDKHPYFFVDRNANGRVDANEADRKNGYAMWTPRLLQAAYNFQFIEKEPGAYAHNSRYALQLLYDSIESLSEKVTIGEAAKLRRP